MALSRPVTGQTHIQDVDVNGLDRFAYGRYRRFLTRGKAVELRAQPDNPADSDAVEVRFDGHQIGWVPRRQNRDIARRLRNGQTLSATVDRHSSEGDLRLSVYIDRSDEDTAKAEPPAVYLLGTVLVTGRPSQSPDNFDMIGNYVSGTVFPLVTSRHRSSITVLDPSTGCDLAWFRKCEISEPARALAEEGRLIVKLKRIRPSDDGWGFDLFEKPATVLTDHGVTVGGKVSFYAETLAAPTTATDNKEITMNNTFFSRLIDTNKKAAGDAAVLEAGRIANNVVTRLLFDRLSIFARFFTRAHADSPLTKLVVANGALALAQQFRPNDPRVRSLTSAMATQAYQEVYQKIDIEGMIEELLDRPEIKRALSQLDRTPAPTE